MKDEIQNNKLIVLGKLAASLAHEIRNPLAALKLNISYLTMSKESFDDSANESISACLESIERIQSLIDNTLEFSKQPTKDVDLHSLNDVTKQAIKIVISTAKRKRIKVETDLQERLPYFLFNKNKILQVVLNLITNAVEATPDGGIVKVNTLLVDDNNIIFEVADNGCGIDKDKQEKIFNDFFTTKKYGTGLGLTVCKMLLDDHDAKIHLESAPGVGTKFTVSFPLNLNEEKHEAQTVNS